MVQEVAEKDGVVVVAEVVSEFKRHAHLWLVPPKDLVFSGLWLAAFLGRQVTWSGRCCASSGMDAWSR